MICKELLMLTSLIHVVRFVLVALLAFNQGMFLELDFVNLCKFFVFIGVAFTCQFHRHRLAIFGPLVSLLSSNTRIAALTHVSSSLDSVIVGWGRELCGGGDFSDGAGYGMLSFCLSW